MNKFYEADNFTVLRELESESIDLIATDPPSVLEKISKILTIGGHIGFIILLCRTKFSIHQRNFTVRQ